MKKITAMVICLVFVLSLVGCGNTPNPGSGEGSKPYGAEISGKVIEWWGSSVDIEVIESNLDSIEKGTRVFIEKGSMNNDKDWVNLSIDDQVKVTFDVNHIKDGTPVSLEKVYSISVITVSEVGGVDEPVSVETKKSN